MNAQQRETKSERNGAMDMLIEVLIPIAALIALPGLVILEWATR